MNLRQELGMKIRMSADKAFARVLVTSPVFKEILRQQKRLPLPIPTHRDS